MRGSLSGGRVEKCPKRERQVEVRKTGCRVIDHSLLCFHQFRPPLFFLISPEFSFIAMFRDRFSLQARALSDVMFEHRTYTPSIGIFLECIAGYEEVFLWWEARKMPAKSKAGEKEKTGNRVIRSFTSITKLQCSPQTPFKIKSCRGVIFLIDPY